MAKTVGIVGAGPSGLVAAKTLLHDAPPGTFEVTIFEAQSRIGGLWPASRDESAGLVHPLMVANQSKHTMQVSDLAWEPNSPEFPKAWQVGRYLQQYLTRYCQNAELQLGSRVESVQPHSVSAGNGAATSSWSVLVKSTNGETVKRRFDYLLVASGFFGQPVLPSLGKAGTEVPIIHSSEYRDLQGLLGKTDGKGRKILVIGGQMSGVETAGTIASHLSSASNSPGQSPIAHPELYTIHHVAQRPAWVFPIHTSPTPGASAPPFVPIDLSSYNLSNRPSPLTNTQGHISTAVAQSSNTIFQGVVGTNQSEFSPLLSIQLPEQSNPPYIVISDTYTEFVRSGMITVSRGKLESFVNQTATIAPSAEQIDDIAAVVCATGFDAAPSLSFLPDSVRQTLLLNPGDLNHTVALAFHGTHHPSVPNLGFVGFYRSPYWGVMEMQARFLTALWSASGPSSPSLAPTIQTALHKDRSVERTLALRNDPRASQFPMGDYPFLMQEFATALGLRRLAPFGTTPRLPPFDKPMDILTPARYPSAAVTEAQAAEVQESLKQTHEAAMSGLMAGKFVARAVFRSLLGEWKLERDLVSRQPSHPSGHFSGTARFLLRDGTRDGRKGGGGGGDEPGRPGDEDGDGGGADLGQEYLYVEEGDFRASNGMTFRAARRYVWRYDEARDRLSVWFVKPEDQRRVDYLFHEIDFVVPGGDGVGVDVGSRGWEAKAGHLCVDDFYDVAYEFWFAAVNLREWRIGYSVSGPKKDYTIDGVYRR